MIETWITAIVITWAIKHFFEKGRQEYAHTRDTHAAELARSHPDWSDRRIQRHARRRARGYWWDQINRGFPDLKAAYEEDRLIAEHARIRADLDGVKRRKELRDRIGEAMAERQRILDKIRAEQKAPQAPKAEEPESTPKDAAEAGAEPEIKPIPAPETAADPKADPKGASEPQGKPVPEAQDAEQDQTRQPDQPSSKPAGDVLPFRRPSTTADTNGEEVPMSTPYTGQTATAEVSEAHGYEQILAAYDAEVEYATAAAEGADLQVANLEAVDAWYERHMSMLHANKADNESIGDVALLREANEKRISAARDAAATSHEHLTAAVAARDNWVSRHGAVNEVKAATGAQGDQSLYDN